MFQLQFNNDFSRIDMDIPHWNGQEDIPINVKDFIADISNKRVFYEKCTGNFYCGKCVGRLDENFCCPNCGIQHNQYDINDKYFYYNRDVTIIYRLALNKSVLNNTCRYLVFNVVNHDVWLYDIEEEISYDNPFYSKPYKTSKLNICLNSSYFVEKDGLVNLSSKLYIPFQFIVDCSNEIAEDFDKYYNNIEHFDIYAECDNIITAQNFYLYVDNLGELRETVYKYSRLWEMRDYLKEQDGCSIENLTLYPLFYPQFEYLVNYKLYNLALYNSSDFTSGNNFKEIFGIEKKNLPFMVENNVNRLGLQILQLCSSIDTETLNFYSKWLEYYMDYVRKLVLEHKVNLNTLKNYLLNLGLSKRHVSDYFDYIYMAKELQLDLDDKKILYPVNLREAHDELFNQIEVVEDPHIDEMINSLSEMLTINRYEDEKYVIYPASSIADLVEESRQQKNCVRTYCDRYAENECQIYFMRKKDDIKKSFVTIEVRENEIVQARAKYNELPSDDIMEILQKWESTLILIKND